jgi:antitoxin HigA-1
MNGVDPGLGVPQTRRLSKLQDVEISLWTSMRATHPIHPGQMLLEEFLLPGKVSQRAFASKLGWTTAKLNELVKGKRGVTAESALDLAKALGTTPELWMNLHMHFHLSRAEAKRRKAS